MALSGLHRAALQEIMLLAARERTRRQCNMLHCTQRCTDSMQTTRRILDLAKARNVAAQAQNSMLQGAAGRQVLASAPKAWHLTFPWLHSKGFSAMGMHLWCLQGVAACASFCCKI